MTEDVKIAHVDPNMYNALFGVNKFATVLLISLDLNPLAFGRFRDCCLDEEGNITVFARVGGGNREDHVPVFEYMRKHRLYLGDRDDDFDSTYCTFTFAVPEDWKPFVKFLAGKGAMDNPGKKFQKLTEMMHDPACEAHPLVVHAKELGRKIFADLGLLDGTEDADVKGH